MDIDALPPYLTVEQAAKVLQIGRSKAYALTVDFEDTNGAEGLPFVWIGNQKRVPKAVILDWLNGPWTSHRVA